MKLSEWIRGNYDLPTNIIDEVAQLETRLEEAERLLDNLLNRKTEHRKIWMRKLYVLNSDYVEAQTFLEAQDAER